KDQGAKYWEKIAKRYITTYGRLNSTRLLIDLPTIYIEHPGLRQNLIYYLLKIGYRKGTANNIIKVVENIDVFDDISLYQLCFLVTQWEIPKNDASKSFLKKFEDQITSFSFNRKLPSDFYCLL